MIDKTTVSIYCHLRSYAPTQSPQASTLPWAASAIFSLVGLDSSSSLGRASLNATTSKKSIVLTVRTPTERAVPILIDGQTHSDEAHGSSGA
jgi:hypothetical protein